MEYRHSDSRLHQLLECFLFQVHDKNVPRKIIIVKVITVNSRDGCG